MKREKIIFGRANKRRYKMKKVFAVLLTILILFSLFQGTLRENAVTADSQPIWPMFLYNAQHTGQCPYDTSNNNGTLKWRYQTGEFVMSSPAIASDGTIYVGSYDNYLYAINPDGTLKWRYQTGYSRSSPAISSDETIYVGSYDGYLYAINPDGTLKWRYKTGLQVFASPAIGSDGTIYVGSCDYYLYAINPDGTLKWRYQTGYRIYSCPAIASDGTVYVGSEDGYLYAINPDGTLKWSYKAGSDIDSSPAIASDGTIYIGSLDSYLYAINPDGTLKWKFETDDCIIFSSPAIGSDGTVYVGSWDYYLYAINPDGTLKWKYPTGGWVDSSPAIASDGTIYAGSYDYYLYAINSNGTLKWRYQTGYNVDSSPAIGSDGTVYVGSWDGYLYAIGPTTYDVTYDANGATSGTVPTDNNTYYTGDTVTVLTNSGNLAKTHYTFNGWNTSSNGSGTHYAPGATFTMGSANVTLYAEWTENPTYAVTYDAQGGSAVDPLTDVPYGSKITAPTPPTRTGYTFAGWYKEAGCTNAWGFDTDTVTSDITLYAKWTVNQYTVTFNYNCSGATEPYTTKYTDYNTSLGSNMPQDPTRTGYNFASWNTQADGNGDAFTKDTVVTNSITVYAKWTINTFTITASATSGGTISPSGTIAVTYGSSKTFTIKADPKFMIFKVLVNGNPITVNNPIEMTYTFTSITSNHTILAEFMKIPDITPPTITYISGIDINVPSEVKTNKDTYTFTVEAFDESGIGRMVVKVNGVVQIDKNNLDPTIYLSEGVNTVEVTVYDTCGNYTIKSFKVIKDSRPPVVNLIIPEKVISSTIEVKGIIYDELSGVKLVLINGTPYNLPLSGNVSLTLNLTGGVNIITVEATDNFENTTKKTYNVTYTPVSATSIIIVLQIDNPEITINGISKKIDAQGSKPIIKNGRTLLPIRVIIESLGGTVEWNAKEQKVTITLNGHSIILWIVKTTALVDRNKVTLDVAPQIINGRTYIPLRFVAENINASVQWDQSNKTVTIYYWP